MDNEQVQRVIEFLISSAEGTKDFVLQQAPEVIQQLILWKRIETTASLIFIVFLGFTGALLLSHASKVFGRITKESNYNDDDRNITLGIICLILGSIGLIGSPIAFLVNFSTTIQVWFAPKVFILEYLAHLTK